MRRLIFCFDGSWMKLTMSAQPTNVVLLSEVIMPIAPDGTQQIVYYDEGVGTASDDKLRGGAFGAGLQRIIHNAYRFLIFNYQPGDEIFVFGFSRGAFTARSFVGYLRCAGILNVFDARQIENAWTLYQRYADTIDDDPPEVLRFRAQYCPSLCLNQAEIDWRARNMPGFDPVAATTLRVRYVGVWDTVGALGWRAVAATFDRRTDQQYRQYNTNLSDTVEAARHAVAIDERTVQFMPTLWNNVAGLNAARGVDPADHNAPYQQRWFPGIHGSVGGGGEIRGLSNGTLQWVIEGAVKQGLKITLDGRSGVREIRYDERAPLANAPPATGTVARVMGWLKDKLMSAPRSGPVSVSDVSSVALRRWFSPADELPEGKPYRPRPLDHIASEIEKLRSDYVAPDGGDKYPLYEVQLGDTLSRIARVKLGAAKRYPEIFALNRDKLDDPDDIFPGQQLRLPPGPVPVPTPAPAPAPAPA